MTGRGKMGEIAQGLMLDLAVLAEGAPEKVVGVGFAADGASDLGDMTGGGAVRHGQTIAWGGAESRHIIGYATTNRSQPGTSRLLVIHDLL